MCFYRVSCDCDREFQQCPYDINSDDADYVGQLLYNVLQLRCLESTCNGTVIYHKQKCSSGKYSIRWGDDITPYKIASKS